MVFFNDCKTLDEAKKLYKKLAFENHPDRGGDNEKMQQINNEYSFFVAKFAKGTAEEINEEFSVAQKFVDVLNKLAGLEGIIVELAGDWLWISGNTYPYKDKLKEIGCRFAPKKKVWYYREEKDKTRNPKPYSMEEIRDIYQAKQVNIKQYEKLAK